jgi:hypothetical protein
MFCRLHSALAVMAVLGTMGIALAQVPRNPPPNRPAPESTGSAPTAAVASSKFLAIPGLAPLGMETVQREIGVAPDQKRQLKAISDGLAASFQRMNSSFRGMSQEEQQNRSKEYSDQASQLARNAQQKAEAILTPAQLQAVKKIAFQLSAAGALSDPGLQEKVGLTAEQRKRLDAVYGQSSEKMQLLQRDTATQVIQLLKEEQVAELKKLLGSEQKPE